MQSAVSERARGFVKTQFDQARCWLAEQVGVMLSSNDNGAKSQHHPDDSINLVSNFESLLVELQTLLIWSNPLNSALALTMFTCLYWLAVLWSPSLISIAAVLFFCYHFYEMWTKYVWPEIRVPTAEIKESWTSINPDVLSAPEIETYLAKLKSLTFFLLSEVIDLRRRSHGTFCLSSISLLTIFYYLGKNIPGVILVYSFAILLFLTPGFLLYVLPIQILESAIEYCNCMVSTKCEQDDEPLSESNDLENSESTMKKESTPDGQESSSSSSFNNNFDENFFSNENAKSNSASSSDISDDLRDFEIISDTDLGEIELK